MRTHFKKSEYFLAAVLALVAGFPFAVEPPVLSSYEIPMEASVLSKAKTIQEGALDNYGNYRENRRDFQKSQELCAQLRKAGQDIECPEVNDLSGIRYFLSTHKTVPVAKAGSGMIVQSTADLTPYQQNLLRWYQKSNVCPDSMKNFLPGFFELCQSLLHKKPASMSRTVVETDSNNVPNTLDQIIDANKGVKRTW